LINRRFDAYFVGYWLTCPILAALPYREASNQQTYQQPLWKTFLENEKMHRRGATKRPLVPHIKRPSFPAAVRTIANTSASGRWGAML